MAKKRKKTSKGGRRRRIGAIADKSTISAVIGVAAGAVVATYAGSKLTSLDPKIRAAVLAAGGFFLAGKASNPIIKGIGLGVAGAGAVNLANAFGVLPAAVGAVPMVRFSPGGLGGFNNYPNLPQANTINGFNEYPNSPQLNSIGNMAAAGIF